DRADCRVELADADRSGEIVRGAGRKDGERRACPQQPVGRKADRTVSAQRGDDLGALLRGLTGAALEVLSGGAHPYLVVDPCLAEPLPHLADRPPRLAAPRRGVRDDVDGGGSPLAKACTAAVISVATVGGTLPCSCPTAVICASSTAFHLESAC